MSVYGERKTKETEIKVRVGRGLGESKIDTGIGFFNHMLELLAFHGQLELEVTCNGDLDVDGHHTVEDVGILMGELLQQLAGDKKTITRYGHAYVPMDETLARTVIDISGRPYLVFNAEISRDKVGSFDTELTEEFFRAVAVNARYTCHLDLLRGGNAHHEIEALFKSFGQALRIALSDSGIERVPSTKGVIQ